MAWLTSWNYRKAITVSNSGSSLTDYQVLTTVDTLTLVNAGKMRSDCGDIRFTSSDGSTLLNYWIESGQNTASTKIWIKSTLVNGNNTVYMYYGNATATSASNGTNTFDFFDDFSGDLSKWNQNRGSVSIAGGVATASGAAITMMSKVSHSSPKIEHWRVKYISDYAEMGGNSNGALAGDLNTGTDHFGVMCYAATNSLWTQAARAGVSSDTNTGITWDLGNYHDYDLIWENGNQKTYRDGSLIDIRTTAPTVDTYPGISIYRAAGGMSIDIIYVRKYASPEPTATLEAEQTPPNITATLMTIIPSESPCRVGICTVTVNVTWTNNGGTSGDFIPNITIDGTPSSSPYPLQSLGNSISVIKTFVISGLVAGTHSICPSPN